MWLLFKKKMKLRTPLISDNLLLSFTLLLYGHMFVCDNRIVEQCQFMMTLQTCISRAQTHKNQAKSAFIYFSREWRGCDSHFAEHHHLKKSVSEVLSLIMPTTFHEHNSQHNLLYTQRCWLQKAVKMGKQCFASQITLF